MISRIEGTLERVTGGSAFVRAGQLVYEVLVPAADSPALATRVGEEVSFETLHYLESQGQGASFWPRLIGFSSSADREFFELFTTVKGIGVRRALRALQVPFHRVAEAICERDGAFLCTLPEIGRKMSETIIVELKDRIDPLRTSPRGRSAGGQAGRPTSLAADAAAVLVQLGEPRQSARDLVDRAISTSEQFTSADALVTAALRLRSS